MYSLFATGHGEAQLGAVLSAMLRSSSHYG
jgi:hypothetical protein